MGFQLLGFYCTVRAHGLEDSGFGDLRKARNTDLPFPWIGFRRFRISGCRSKFLERAECYSKASKFQRLGQDVYHILHLPAVGQVEGFEYGLVVEFEAGGACI